MSNTSNLQTQMLIGALGTMGRLAHQHGAQRHERAVEELRHASMGHLIDALIHRRIDVVQNGFLEILRSYADQARAYVEEKKIFAAAELAETDLLRRVEQRARLKELDREIAALRADMQLLYTSMTEVIVAIDGSAAGFEMQLPQILALPRG